MGEITSFNFFCSGVKIVHGSRQCPGEFDTGHDSGNFHQQERGANNDHE